MRGSQAVRLGEPQDEHPPGWWETREERRGRRGIDQRRYEEGFSRQNNLCQRPAETHYTVMFTLQSPGGGGEEFREDFPREVKDIPGSVCRGAGILGQV